MTQSTRSSELFLIVGVAGCIGAMLSPNILGNNTDPSPSFVRAVIFSVVSLLALGVVCAHSTMPGRIVVTILMLVDLWVAGDCLAWLLAR